VFAPLTNESARALLAPSARVLVTAAMPAQQVSTPIVASLFREVDWGALLALAQFERAEAHLLRVLRDAPVGVVPEDVVRALDGVVRVGRFRASELSDAAARVVDAFAARGVRAIWLKGAALAMQHPAGFAARGMGDIDVLIAEQDRAAAHDAVRDAGWRASADPATYDAHHHDAPYELGDGLRLELHGGVFPPGHPFVRAEGAAWFGRTRSVVWSGHTVTVLDSTWHLVHAATHWAWSHEGDVGTWQWLHDAWRLTVGWQPDDLRWGVVTRHAAELGAERPVGWALWFAARVAGVPVPEAVLTALRGAPPRLQGLTERVWVTRAFWSATPSPSVRWSRYFWRLAMGGLGEADAQWPWSSGRVAAHLKPDSSVRVQMPSSTQFAAWRRHLGHLFRG
jgi:hypothetical protein